MVLLFNQGVWAYEMPMSGLPAQADEVDRRAAALEEQHAKLERVMEKRALALEELAEQQVGHDLQAKGSSMTGRAKLSGQLLELQSNNDHSACRPVSCRKPLANHQADCAGEGDLSSSLSSVLGEVPCVPLQHIGTGDAKKF
jgi:hypothetical protein